MEMTEDVPSLIGEASGLGGLAAPPAALVLALIGEREPHFGDDSLKYWVLVGRHGRHLVYSRRRLGGEACCRRVSETETR